MYINETHINDISLCRKSTPLSFPFFNTYKTILVIILILTTPPKSLATPTTAFKN